MHQRNISEYLLSYWPVRHDIHIADDLLMKGHCVLIPKKMRQEMLERAHEGHQEISKCIRRAQHSLWWPGVTQDIQEMGRQISVHEKFAPKWPNLRDFRKKYAHMKR